MINIDQFRKLIIESSLNDLMLYSSDAEELLVFTCAAESDGGSFLHQVNGRALGIYQMEPETYNDIWQNYIKLHPHIGMLLSTNFNIVFIPSEDRLIYDLRFCTAMTRLFYARFPEPLPDCNNVDAIWNYYKKYYNTARGAAEKYSAIKKYLRFTGKDHTSE